MAKTSRRMNEKLQSYKYAIYRQEFQFQNPQFVLLPAPQKVGSTYVFFQKNSMVGIKRAPQFINKNEGQV